MTHRWLSGSAEYLERAWDAPRGLFSYSSTPGPGGEKHDYGHPAAVRYTINSLLGLQEAGRNGIAGTAVETYSEKLDAFLAAHGSNVADAADRGLLLLLLARDGRGEEAARLFRDVNAGIEAGKPVAAGLQAVAWTIWGTAAAAATGTEGAEAALRKVFRALHSMLVDNDSLLARHSLQRYRRDVVSFGATAYYLRALHEYATATGDEYALTVFDWAVRRVLALQGPQGEWPWMISVRRAAVIDPYPVFTVHQDSMAMLFLHPALERGIPGADEAIVRSCRWNTGANELRLDLVTDDPFAVAREIRRRESLPRVRRYARSLRPVEDPWKRRGTSVEVNPECRSYHLGWVLFTWAARQDLLASAVPEAG